MTRRILGLVMGGALLLAIMAPGLAAQEDTFEWSGRIDAGAVLEVTGITGSIQVGLASGNTVEVTAVKHGKRSDFDAVEIRVFEDRGGVTVCAVYGTDDRGDADCDSDNDGRRGRSRRSIDVSVDFVVRLPAGVEFEGTMVTGDIEVEGVESEVDLTTVTGDIVVSTTELVEATTVTGSMDIEIGRADWDALDFKTVTGDITLRLPDGVDTDVEFESLSGDMDSDFDLTMSGRSRRRWIGSHIRGTIGDGGRSLSLKTVSGDVRLVRSR